MSLATFQVVPFKNTGAFRLTEKFNQELYFDMKLIRKWLRKKKKKVSKPDTKAQGKRVRIDDTDDYTNENDPSQVNMGKNTRTQRGSGSAPGGNSASSAPTATNRWSRKDDPKTLKGSVVLRPRKTVTFSVTDEHLSLQFMRAPQEQYQHTAQKSDPPRDCSTIQKRESLIPSFGLKIIQLV